MSSTGTYLYAICRPVQAAALGAVRGVSGSALRVIGRDGLGCVVSSVDLDEFGEAPLREHLADLAWLERVAREHDAVVQAVAALTTTAPLRLATICRDDAAAQTRLAALAPAAGPLLDRLTGRAEWGVKVFVVSHRRADAGVSAGGSGAAYLRQRRDELADRRQAADEAARQAGEVYDRLAATAVAGCRHRPQDSRLSGAADPMVLNAAFLVEHERGGEFAAAASALGDEYGAIRLELTGPWPPYSFAGLEQH
jgi:hypothetical protein